MVEGHRMMGSRARERTECWTTSPTLSIEAYLSSRGRSLLGERFFAFCEKSHSSTLPGSPQRFAVNFSLDRNATPSGNSVSHRDEAGHLPFARTQSQRARR